MNGGADLPQVARALHPPRCFAGELNRRQDQRNENAENGTIVVALVDDQEVTLKRLRRKGNSVALEAANPAYETRIFGPDRVKVQGRLLGLLRRY
jgi:hypothetical protein